MQLSLCLEGALQVRPLFDRKTRSYSYLVYDLMGRESLIIDPVLEQSFRDIRLIKELELNLKYILETHIHDDHFTGAFRLKQEFKCPIGLSKDASTENVDLILEQNSILKLGEHNFYCLSTPGHTNGCLSFYTQAMVFTGDCLLIRDCQRISIQGGDLSQLFYSIKEVIYSLPNETYLYPGHDYQGLGVSTIEEEKKNNPIINMNTTENMFKKTQEIRSSSLSKDVNDEVLFNLRCGYE